MQNFSPLLLVDGTSYIYRAYHAMPELTNSKNEPTGAIYGVINMLRRLLKEYQPNLMAVIFDAKGKTFRHQLYASYKATRPPMPDDLKSQLKPLYEIVGAMGLPLLCVEGVEADDVIGTLAKQASKLGLNTVISTGDKDMAQLVDGHVSLINTMSNTAMDVNGVAEKFGIGPGLIVDYLTLMGDTSDNIPGVAKVGPKTAVKWLLEYGSLDAVVANANNIGGKVGENLRNSIDQLPLSKQLATIECSVNLALGPKELVISPPNKDRLKDLFGQLEFKSWLAEVLASDRATASPNNQKTNHDASEKPDYQTVTTEKQLNVWLEKLQAAPIFAFDTETTSLDHMNAKIVGVSFCVKANEAAYVPLAHTYDGAPRQLDRDWVLAQLRPLLEDPKQYKLGQNLKYDMGVLANHDIQLCGIQYDTMLESYVYNSTASRHDMDSLALKYLNHNTIHFKDIAGSGKKQLRFDQIAIEDAATYAAEDADVTLRLHLKLWPYLSEEPELKRLFSEIEIPLIPVLSHIERNGVLIDADLLAKQSIELADGLKVLEAQAYDVAGEAFNLASPKQIQAILYDKLGLPISKKTPKGQPSTAEAVLQDLALNYPLPKLILEHRGMSKLKSTYTDKLPLQINERTGRIHTSYHQAVASTGRLSSTEPNLQNIPIRNPAGRRIRQAFIAPPGYKILAADYSQIELRIMAHLSADQGLLDAFAADIDIHRATAAEVFGLEAEAVADEHRRKAKAINFGLIYGMSAYGLGRQLGIGRNEAQAYIDLYFNRYPGVKTFMDRTREQARDQGYVSTVFGRRLYLPEINHRNAQRRQYAERTAINAPMQGTAADIIKRAMIGVDVWLQSDRIDVKMIMQVHDELVFEIADAAVEPARGQIEKYMNGVVELSVPLKVDIGVGSNWDEAH